MRIAKDKLWRVLKELVHKRDGGHCISCGAKNLNGRNRHGGHFLASASCGGFLRYDLRNVWSQCARCNTHLGGAGPEYTRALEKLFSRKFVDQLLEDKNVSIKLDIQYIEALTELYKELLTMTPKQLMELTRTYKGFKNE